MGRVVKGLLQHTDVRTVAIIATAANLNHSRREGAI